MTVKENTKEYVCFYGHRFLGKDIKLLAFKNESRELLGHMTFVKADDEYYRGGRPPEGYVLACPVCNVIQLGGFLCPDDKSLDASKLNEPNRNIQLHL